jgi:hypothetical protein
MAKRFTETTIWDDDWFYELSPEYKLFWFYIKDNCNHGGIWQPKIRAFKSVSDTDVDLNKALEYFNMGKQRIRVLGNGRWFIEDFFLFQNGHIMNLTNRVHKSILELIFENYIPVSSIKGLNEIKISKDKDHTLSWTVSEFEILIENLTWGQIEVKLRSMLDSMLGSTIGL